MLIVLLVNQNGKILNHLDGFCTDYIYGYILLGILYKNYEKCNLKQAKVSEYQYIRPVGLRLHASGRGAPPPCYPILGQGTAASLPQNVLKMPYVHRSLLRRFRSRLRMPLLMLLALG